MDKKKPDLRLKALYVTPVGSQILKVEPKKGAITIDGVGSWDVPPGSTFPPGAPFDVILPYDSGVALAWSGKVLPSPEAFDEALHNSYREQVDKNAKGSSTKRVAWVSMGLNVVTILVVILAWIALSGQMDDMGLLLRQAEQAANQDVTRVSTGG